MISEENRAQLAGGAEDHPDLFQWSMKLTFPGFAFKLRHRNASARHPNNCTFGQI